MFYHYCQILKKFGLYIPLLPLVDNEIEKNFFHNAQTHMFFLKSSADKFIDKTPWQSNVDIAYFYHKHNQSIRFATAQSLDHANLNRLYDYQVRE